MSNAAQNDIPELIVDQPLADELERRGVHGVHVGDRVRLELIHGRAAGHPGDDFDRLLAGYAGSFDSGDPTLARRAKEIARTELGTS